MKEAYPKERHGARLVFLAIIASQLGGCSGGAPSFVIFGAYFPAWLLSAMIGVCGALGARVFIGASRADTPYLLFVCVSVGIVAGSLFWLVLFGR